MIQPKKLLASSLSYNFAQWFSFVHQKKNVCTIVEKCRQEYVQ